MDEILGAFNTEPPVSKNQLDQMINQQPQSRKDKSSKDIILYSEIENYYEHPDQEYYTEEEDARGEIQSNQLHQDVHERVNDLQNIIKCK